MGHQSVPHSVKESTILSVWTFTVFYSGDKTSENEILTFLKVKSSVHSMCVLYYQVKVGVDVT